MAIFNAPLGSPEFVVASLLSQALFLITAVLSILTIIFSFSSKDRMKYYKATLYLLLCVAFLLLVDYALLSWSFAYWWSGVESTPPLWLALAAVIISFVVVTIRTSTGRKREGRR